MRHPHGALLIAVVTAISLKAAQTAEPLPETGVSPPSSPQATPQLNANAGAGYLIEFLGREPADDWAKSARVLEKAGLVPRAQLQLREGEDPCSALLEKLNFRSSDLKLGCSAEVTKLIGELNPALGRRPLVGATLVYPDLPVEPMSWFAGFDLSLQTQVDKYKKVTEAWKLFKIKETPRNVSSQVQVEFRGFRARIPPSNSSEVEQALTSVETYDPTLDRYITRVLPLSSTPLMKKQYSMTDPIGWGKVCLENPNHSPAPPGPPYISLINGKKEDLECITNCTKGGTACPEIVLIDQKPAPHPDIAAALGVEPSESVKPDWCPFIPFDREKQHGTHMAGIMVGAGRYGFLGFSPGASIDNRDIGKLFEQNIPAIAKEKSDSTRPELFVFASQFPAAPTALTNSEARFHVPRYVEDILESQKLWIVAAGETSKEQPEPIEIGKQTPVSPMNLGDRPTVLVVTACDDCYGSHPKIASWANYSGSTNGGLVNIAAPGGSAGEGIPAPVTESNDALAYGTSQATALVGGLAAAMVSCYPDAFSNSRLLKNRLLTTARPPISQDLADKVSVGIVDAGMALHSPYFHWVTLKAAGVEKQFKEIRWCRKQVIVSDLNADEDAAPRNVDVNSIRRIVRDDSTPGTWYVFYRSHEMRVEVGRVTNAPDKLDPLLYLVGAPHKVEPSIPIDEIDDLLVGLPPKAKVQVPPNFAGCKS
jgi:hypothetical protein